MNCHPRIQTAASRSTRDPAQATSSDHPIDLAIAELHPESPPQCKKRLLREVSQGASAPRCVGHLVSRLVFQERATELSDPVRAAISELFVFVRSLEQSDVSGFLSSASSEAFVDDVFQALLDLHHRKDTNPLILIATLCPDYPSDSESKTFKFQGEIGTSVGLVGEELLRHSAEIGKLLTAHAIPFQVQFLYADHEARDPFLQGETGLSEKEFVDRLSKSVEALQAKAERCFRSENIAGAIHTGFMSQRIGKNPDRDPDIKAVRGIAMHRTELYRRLFAKHCQSSSRHPGSLQPFFESRARRDISDHLNLGEAVSKMREDGERASILTLSVRALSRFFNHEGCGHIPVFSCTQNY